MELALKTNAVTLYLLFHHLGRVTAAFLSPKSSHSPAFCFQGASGKQAASLELKAQLLAPPAAIYP